MACALGLIHGNIHMNGLDWDRTKEEVTLSGCCPTYFKMRSDEAFLQITTAENRLFEYRSTESVPVRKFKIQSWLGCLKNLRDLENATKKKFKTGSNVMSIILAIKYWRMMK
ncbi:hypothetical protein AVEN_154879-1 [Araneus ventricosus]|uniref:Uncharacterized protein n=1 Tax=Araneus ventricosus TaxID=182803 RepID=A0A4Y2A8I1_ARAVE|nr:hypothetical protein AVEN_154879-1 [Araneus ventricosus]